MTGPYRPEFWQEYNRMMQNTMENVQRILQSVGANIGNAINEGVNVSNESLIKAGWWGRNRILG